MSNEMINNTFIIDGGESISGEVTYTLNRNIYTLYLTARKRLNNGYISDVYIGTGFDIDEAMASLCNDMGILRQLPKTKYVRTPKRNYNKCYSKQYKSLVKLIYQKFIDMGLIIYSEDKYEFTKETFGYHKRNGKVTNEGAKHKLVHETCQEDNHLTILHIPNKDKSIIEITRKYGSSNKSYFTSNSIALTLPNKTSEILTDAKVYSKENDLFEKCIKRENELLHKLPIQSLIHCHLKTKWFDVDSKDNTVVYSSKYVTLTISKGNLEDKVTGYFATINCYLLGRRIKNQFKARSINNVLELVAGYIFQEMLNRDIVSIPVVYNRALFLFDNAILMGELRERLTGYLSLQFNNKLV